MMKMSNKEHKITPFQITMIKINHKKLMRMILISNIEFSPIDNISNHMTQEASSNSCSKNQ